MNANIVITDIQIAPRTVETGGTFKIVADIEPIIQVLGDDTARIIDADGAYIQVLDRTKWILSDNDNCLIADTDGMCIEIYEEEA